MQRPTTNIDGLQKYQPATLPTNHGVETQATRAEAFAGIRRG